jgi:EmrB/QacA subfamily drug resistance transporter
MADSEDRLDKTMILGMFAMAMGVLIIANDFTALAVAIPAIEKEFGTDVTMTQWVINGYAMVFGVVIVTGGRLADMLGRRRIFFIGAAIFAVFSVIGGFAPNIWMLLACRCLMGIGGAMMWPAILGMTYSLLPKSKAGLAGGLILGAAGFGNAVGPLIGGVLTDTVGWRWIFFLNLPVAVAGVLITLLVVARDKPVTQHAGIDYRGMAILSLGLFALLLALDEGTDLGWTDPFILLFFVVAAAAMIGFAWAERGIGEKALVPEDVMKNRAFAAASLATLLSSAIFFAALVYLPQFMSKILGFAAIGAGAGLLPMMGTFAITSFVSGTLYAKLGPKVVVSLGAALLSAGMFLLSAIDASTVYTGLVFGMVVLGIGVGLFYSSITTAAITSLDESRASLGGAIIYMFEIAGGSIGLGLNTAIVVTGSSIPEGIHTAFLVDGALALGALAVAIFFIGGQVDLERLRDLQHHHRAHG